MPKKQSNRSELLAALVALTNEYEGVENPADGFKPIKALKEYFDLGDKQTYVWLERLVRTGLAEKRQYRVRVGIYRREIPHYKIGKKALDVVMKLRRGRKPRGEA